MSKIDKTNSGEALNTRDAKVIKNIIALDLKKSFKNNPISKKFNKGKKI